MTYGIWLGIALGVLSCACYTAAAVTQRWLATVVTTPLTGRGALAELLGRPLWWVSAALNAGRAGFQVGALGFAPLTVIQPLNVLVLIFGLPWSARVSGRRVTPREWRGAALTVAALGVLLSVAVTGGSGHALGRADALLVVSGTLALLLVAAWTAGRLRSAAWRSHLLAAAAGVAFGNSSATAKTTITAAGTEGAAVALHPAAVGTAVIAIAGLLLAQAAYQGMELGAPLGITTLANPVAAAIVGVAFMGESYSGGWVGLGIAAACAVAGAYGITLLTVPDSARAREKSPAGDDGLECHGIRT
ncbi:DMT family transporter [Lipingzhangella halophila]|nr:DMT family transporter [Lipingzhangella halophila]